MGNQRSSCLLLISHVGETTVTSNTHTGVKLGLRFVEGVVSDPLFGLPIGYRGHWFTLVWRLQLPLPWENWGWRCKLFINLLCCLSISPNFSAVLSLLCGLRVLSLFCSSLCSLSFVTQTLIHGDCWRKLLLLHHLQRCPMMAF
jgi:hypothetical protein